MSHARECDACGKLHSREQGVLSLEIHAATKGRYDAGWEIDLCRECSDRVLAVIKPAMSDFDKEIEAIE